MSESIIKIKSFSFAKRIVLLCKIISKRDNEYILTKQLMRSGTAIGALVREAQNAESTKDFIHKLGIAQKESDETMYWLELMEACDYLNSQEFVSIHADASDLLKMIRSAILTTKAKMKK